ncbi:MAG: type II secretion system F family protein [Rugosibacter sp.]|nr:type II secretion system F family protein [Rugosibacter sp.]
MTTQQWIYLGFVFLVVAGVGYFILSQLAPNRVKDRLGRMIRHETTAEQVSAPHWVEKFIEIAAPLAKLSVPEEGWEKSTLRTRFMNAGYREGSIVTFYFIAKTLLAALFAGAFFFYMGISGQRLATANYLMYMLFAAALGYYLPNVILARRIEYRQREIFETFPDATDLMLVCVEAGLGLDAALIKVGQEIRLKSPVLADELQLVSLELRAGSSKERALRNLALRTGVEYVDSLVAMLIQADRFGTSIGDSLRVYADELRTKRRLLAEEMAAKIPLKLLFPLIFFIFPSLLLVLLGPAFIQIYRILLPTLGGNQ